MCLSGLVTRAACRVERARGSLSFLNDRGISPFNEGQEDGIELAAFFGQEIFVNPRRLSRRHFLQPQGGPFSSASLRAAVLTNPAKTGFLHICEA